MKQTMTASEIRESFLEFFRGKGHEIVAGAPVVLPSDPTLLFTNAGMNPFKEIFLGAREPEASRVADTQKCIRVSGKHNDLEEVGRDTYHHTFFEMLGNWSFGDYYKREVIAWAWELLTEVWGLEKDRMWATVHHTDDEAEALWKEVTDIRPDHILRFGDKDNFWEMGETGPCGPCSEIHIDLTPDKTGKALVNADSPEVIELWNLVFIQHNRKSDGTLEDLPSRHVDTGMGFERLVAVLQGKASNYDTDLFTPVIEKLKQMTGRRYEGDDAVGMRVIADHLRALSIAISDGVMPSNEGRGYVLRRLLRRAVRFGRQLGFRDPFMAELFPLVEESLGPVFPDLANRRDTIRKALTSEEESFAATIDRGIVLFEDVVDALRKHRETVFPGDQAFKLYDTYGFPLDLTVMMAGEEGLSVDEEQFDRLMEEQRERARHARKDAMLDADADLVAALVQEGVRSRFVGYDAVDVETRIRTLVRDGQKTDRLPEGEEGMVILEETPFYAESGGQIGDRGAIRTRAGEFEVWDTQRPAEGLILHIGKMVSGELAAGADAGAVVDTHRRARTAAHHTATHLLNEALCQVVDGSIRQAGSLVAPDHLRFDFTCSDAIPAEHLEEIEHRVNGWIMQDDDVRTYEIPFKEVEGSGIKAVFDEKYGDVVRVVDIAGYSRELCGGTHVERTGRLGPFRLLRESSVASGIRRVEAVCGWPAYEVIRREHDIVHSLAARFSAREDEVVDRVDALASRVKVLEKALKEKEVESARGQVDTLLENREEIDGVAVVAAELPGQTMDGLRRVMDSLRNKVDSGIVILGGSDDKKAAFVAEVTADVQERGVRADQLIRDVAKIAGGSGGGQPHKAQAGGKQPDKVGEAIAAAPALIRDALAAGS